MRHAVVERSRTPAILCALLVGGQLLCACMETRRAIGEACLKNDDCLSGICSQLVCVAPPPLLDAQIVADAGPTGAEDATGDLDSTVSDGDSQSSTSGDEGSGD